jgi:hypothetical protein
VAAKRALVTISAGLASVILLVGGVYVVGRNAFHVWGSDEANRPKQLGPGFAVATTDDSTAFAWIDPRGICITISIHDHAEGEGCGMPVIGAPRDSKSSQPPPRQVVGVVATSPGIDDTSTYVVGPASRSVARVTVEVRDGRVLDTQTLRAPNRLKTPLRFYAIQIPNVQPTQAAPGAEVISPIKTIRAYDAAGLQLGSVTVPG